MRKVISLKSAEFFVTDSSLFCDSNRVENLIEVLPYRIIIALEKDEKKEEVLSSIPPQYRKRVSFVLKDELKDEDAFKKAIHASWYEKIKTHYSHNAILCVNLHGSHSDEPDEKYLLERIEEDILKNCTEKKIFEWFNRVFGVNKARKILKLYIKNNGQQYLQEYEEITKGKTHNTLLRKMFSPVDSEAMANQQTSIREPDKYISKDKLSDIRQFIVISRHATSPWSALQEFFNVDIKKELEKKQEDLFAYFEPLSGANPQFALYQELLEKKENRLYAKMKIEEAAMMRIGIFDERIIDNITRKHHNVSDAASQNLFLIASINGFHAVEANELDKAKMIHLEIDEQKCTYKIADSDYAEMTAENAPLDVLIVHYGLIEKMKNDLQMTEESFKKLMRSFPMAVITSGRGGITEYQNHNAISQYKFLGYSSLQEYFSQKTINKIGLVNSLTSLIGRVENV